MGIEKETYIENIVLPVCYLIVMLVSGNYCPSGLEDLL